MNETKPNTIDIKTTFAEIQQMYKAAREFNNIGIFLMGLYGSGKTSMICTGRTPILIDSFDPNGTAVIEANYAKQIASGEIMIRTYWNDNHKNPKAFSQWEKDWEQLSRSGAFNTLGTYAIDSSTFWCNSAIYAISKSMRAKNPQQRVNIAEGDITLGDYKPLGNTLKTYIRMMSDFSCDFVMTCHLETMKDEITGAISTEPTLPGKLKVDVPALFTEKYVITRKGKEAKLLTSPKGRDRASTQIGKNFEIEEKPDIKYLLNKANFKSQNKINLLDEKNNG